MLRTKILFATWLALGLGSEKPMGPIPVQLLLRTEMTGRAVEQLRDEVDEIFAPAGIRFDWRSAGTEARVRVIVEPRPRYKVITGCSRDLHDHRLGNARPATRTVTLWTEQVARGAAGDWYSRDPPSVSDDILGRALGRVLAHELGHLFLGLRDHRSRGLMKSAFKYRELSSRTRRALRLSPRDVRELREGASILLAVPPSWPPP